MIAAWPSFQLLQTNAQQGKCHVNYGHIVIFSINTEYLQE